MSCLLSSSVLSLSDSFNGLLQFPLKIFHVSRMDSQVLVVGITGTGADVSLASFEPVSDVYPFLEPKNFFIVPWFEIFY